MELLRSNKGKQLLVLNGFTYGEHSRSKNVWRCNERSACNARVHTTADLADLRLLKDGTGAHIGHLADQRHVETRKVVQGTKRHAEEHPNEPPQPQQVIQFYTTRPAPSAPSSCPAAAAASCRAGRRSRGAGAASSTEQPAPRHQPAPEPRLAPQPPQPRVHHHLKRDALFAVRLRYK